MDLKSAELAVIASDMDRHWFTISSQRISDETGAWNLQRSGSQNAHLVV